MPEFITELAVDREAVIREIGYKNAAAAAPVSEEITAAVAAVKRALRPGVVYAEYPVRADTGAARLLLPKGAIGPGGDIFRCLSQADSLIVAVATVGDLQAACRMTPPGPGDLFFAYLADAIGTVALYELEDAFWRRQAGLADARGAGITGLFLPGEGEWGVEDQGTLFANVDAAAIGVSITGSCLLTPLKSVSMICGAGSRIKTPQAGHHCGNCGRVDCPRRA
jgi:hypothetical protein